MLTHESGIFNECCKMQNPVICSLTQARSSWEDYTASRICKCLCLTKQKCWFWVSFLRNLIWAFGEWCQERNENSLRKDLGQRRRKSMKKVFGISLSSFQAEHYFLFIRATGTNFFVPKIRSKIMIGFFDSEKIFCFFIMKKNFLVPASNKLS